MMLVDAKEKRRLLVAEDLLLQEEVVEGFVLQLAHDKRQRRRPVVLAIVFQVTDDIFQQHGFARVRACVSDTHTHIQERLAEQTLAALACGQTATRYQSSS